MNREELIKQKNKIQAELDRLTELINKSAERWKPEYGSYYYYLASNGKIVKTDWINTDGDDFRFDTGNCFKTEQEAIDYKENLITKQQLKNLAFELNNGKEINWNDGYSKYSLLRNCYSSETGTLESLFVYNFQSPGNVYCLNKDFLKIAKERIGEEKLIKLIKSGV